MKIINHLGKEFITSHYDSSFTSEQCDNVRDIFFNKVDIEEVYKEIQRLYYNNGKDISQIYDYFFYELACECKLKSSKWSIKEFLQSDDLIRFAISKINSFPEIYSDKSLIKNIKTVFRLSPSGTAGKLSNFPYNTINDILNKYLEPGDNYYDYSCGWGVRLTGALSNNINYYGTEPNKPLVDKLEELANKFYAFTDTTSEVNIKQQGSEYFVPKWENTMDLAFSSPPYYDLEEYSLNNSNQDDQSIVAFPDYNNWLRGYWQKTVENIFKYLKDDGIFIVNIKNIKEYNHNLLDDFKNIIELENDNYSFKYIESLEVENINRPSLENANTHNNEVAMVFNKYKYPKLTQN